MKSHDVTEEQLEQRALRRNASVRYAANVLTVGDFLNWGSRHLKSGVRQGRLTADLLLTQEAFDALPGDESQGWTNGAGELVFRKKVALTGAFTLEVRAMMIAPSDQVVHS